MGIIQCTPEQAATFNRNKTRVLKENTNTVVTPDGEILQETVDTAKMVSTEPDYIKIYYETCMAFNAVKGIPAELLIEVGKRMTYSNKGGGMLFQNTKAAKDEICDALGIKQDMYNKYIKRAKDQGLLVPTKYRAIYEANGFFIAKGEWRSIEKLRQTFNYIDGTWSKDTEGIAVDGTPATEIATGSRLKGKKTTGGINGQMAFDVSDPTLSTYYEERA